MKITSSQARILERALNEFIASRINKLERDGYWPGSTGADVHTAETVIDRLFELRQQKEKKNEN
jgi:hypothetical protein